ncbi:MAG: VPLPA-CTERM sorting domain-containing protein [Pseudomonadota bacterium]|nr:VPLPA-CTERM sorting domain-containing protein [Pseudomonadota bacterium]
MNLFKTIATIATLAVMPVGASATTQYLGSPVGSYALTGASGAFVIEYDVQSVLPDADEYGAVDYFGFFWEMTADAAYDYDITVTGTLHEGAGGPEFISDLYSASIGPSTGYGSTGSKTIFSRANYNTGTNGGSYVSPAVSLLAPASTVAYLSVEFNDLKQGYQTFEVSWTASMPAVPLPAALPLMVAALGGLGYVARKRRRDA